MMHDPFFSIIIPSYNRAHLIEKTLLSVLNQRYDNYEVIVVDDGSTDNTAEVVGRFTNPKLIFLQKTNGERAAARNYGVKHAKGKYITFCDSDDLIYPDYLSFAFETIQNNKDLSWMHLGYEIIRPHGRAINMSWKKHNFMLNLAKGNPLSCMGVFVREDAMRVNLFNENRHLSGSEDWELWLRLASRFPIVFDQRIAAALVIHGERSVVQTDELSLLLRKFLSIGYAFDDPEVQKEFGQYKSIMFAYFDTYISLHLLLGRKTIASVKYLISAIKEYPSCIFERRFLAIIKYFLLNITYLRKREFDSL